MNTYIAAKLKAEKESAFTVEMALVELLKKAELAEHERAVKAALCDVLEDRKGLAYVERVLDAAKAARSPAFAITSNWR